MRISPLFLKLTCFFKLSCFSPYFLVRKLTDRQSFRERLVNPILVLISLFFSLADILVPTTEKVARKWSTIISKQKRKSSIEHSKCQKWRFWKLFVQGRKQFGKSKSLHLHFRWGNIHIWRHANLGIFWPLPFCHVTMPYTLLCDFKNE